MSIDVDKHKNAILEAFNDVVSDKTKTDWALFGYEGQTNVLKFVGKGEDGLEEMAEDLNSSKIMYAVVKVTDPNTTRPKIILINWQGEGAPTLRKGTCARHLTDVHRLLRGIHVTVNARTEEEVEPEVVMAAVLKASATTYNFNERSEINEKSVPVKGLVDTFKRGEATGAVPKPSGPAVTCGDGSQTYPSKKPKLSIKVDMGTNYKRTNPLAEINTRSRNQFWEEQEAEEKKRRTEEQKRKDEELQQIERERKQREIEDAKQREALSKERNARIHAERKAEEDAAKRLASKDEKKWQQDLQSQYQEEQERARRAEMMRLERKKEAESLIGQRTHSTRAIFESGSSTSQKPSDLTRPPPRKLKEFKPANDTERVENNDMPTVVPSKGVTARWPPANPTAQKEDTSPSQNRAKVASVSSNFRSQMQATLSSSAVPNKQPFIPAASNANTAQPAPQPVPEQQPIQPPPVQQQSGQPHSNGDLHSDVYDTTVLPSKAVTQTVSENDDNVYDATICTTANAPENNHENYYDTNIQTNSPPPATGMVYEVDGVEYQILPEHGLCARALYDYQAADDTEITFDPEEIITNIDQIDAGWWQGVGPDGSFGLFPANYVELINQPAV